MDVLLIKAVSIAGFVLIGLMKIPRILRLNVVFGKE